MTLTDPHIATSGGANMGGTMARVEAEVLAIGSVLGSVFGALPYFVALLAAIWYMINIWESTPVQNYLAKRRLRAIGTAAYEKTVSTLPEAVPMPTAVVIGSLASAKAVIAEKKNLEEKEDGQPAA